MVALLSYAKMTELARIVRQLGNPSMSDKLTISGSPEDQAKRREFLKKCGRFAAVTPPAITLLLSVASVPKEAHASTIGQHWGSWGNSQGGGNNNQGGNNNNQH